ncbi:MAG TPA: carboxypeptidase-like regulatory domain-containing protein, partial [Nitrospiraceae bacterium]
MRPIIWSHRIVRSVCLCVVCMSFLYQGHAVAAEPNLITGLVQNQDLRRVDQAIVQVRDQEGTVVTQGVANQAGEFSVSVPQEGAYSVSAIHETYRSEYVVVKIGTEPPAPVTLTL